MLFLKGHHYKLCFKVGDVILTFTAKIVSSDENFITFTDRYNKTLSYNFNSLISLEEV